ncbi:hypothetical protein D3C81_1364880 [compost metagenome]
MSVHLRPAQGLGDRRQNSVEVLDQTVQLVGDQSLRLGADHGLDGRELVRPVLLELGEGVLGRLVSQEVVSREVARRLRRSLLLVRIGQTLLLFRQRLRQIARIDTSGRIGRLGGFGRRRSRRLRIGGNVGGSRGVRGSRSVSSRRGVRRSSRRLGGRRGIRGRRIGNGGIGGRNRRGRGFAALSFAEGAGVYVVLIGVVAHGRYLLRSVLCVNSLSLGVKQAQRFFYLLQVALQAVNFHLGVRLSQFGE